MPLLKLCKSTICPICEDIKLSNDFSINSKSSTRFSCKSMKIIKRGRLSGGADANDIKVNTAESTSAIHMEPPVETVAEPSTVSSTKLPASTSNFANQPIDYTSGPCCLCATHLTGTSGDNKVNEIIDYAHQNLQDAGKALATLEENFEHGLKLAIADVLGRIQQWSSTVQNKLDICKGDIENLRKELISRICDINDKENKIKNLNSQIADLLSQIDQLKQEIAECSAARANLEKLLAEKMEIIKQKEAEIDALKELQKEIPPPKVEPVVPEPIVEPPPPPPKPEVIEVVDTPTVSAPVEKPKKTDESKKCLEQMREKERERKRRESELEAEIARLRKENEKIMKEKIDYENAIQRALLRGVSSLNVEALRVLRCPPIPCCTPCVPCPMSLGATVEQTVPCPVKMKKTCTTRAANKVCGRGNGNGKNSKYDPCDFMIKQPCASPCCVAEKSPQVSDNSLFFLLHQGDAENVCGANEVPSPRPCGSPIMKKIEIPPCPRFTRP